MPLPVGQAVGALHEGCPIEPISAHGSGFRTKRTRRDLVLPLSKSLLPGCGVQKET